MLKLRHVALTVRCARHILVHERWAMWSKNKICFFQISQGRSSLNDLLGNRTMFTVGITKYLCDIWDDHKSPNNFYMPSLSMACLQWHFKIHFASTCINKSGEQTWSESINIYKGVIFYSLPTKSGKETQLKWTKLWHHHVIQLVGQMYVCWLLCLFLQTFIC